MSGERRSRNSRLAIRAKLALVALPVGFLLAVLGVTAETAAASFADTLDFSLDAIGDRSHRVFIDEWPETPALRSIGTSAGHAAVELVFAPLKIVWQPSRFPLWQEEVAVVTELRGSASLAVRLLCAGCTPDQKELDKPLFIPGIQSYHRTTISQPTRVQVYTKNPVPPPGDQALRDWLFTAIPAGTPFHVTSHQVIAQSDLLAADMPEPRQGVSEITLPLQGQHRLFVVAGQTLAIEVTKRDLNAQAGRDSVRVQINRSDGRTLHEETIPDDGVVRGLIGQPGERQTVTVVKRVGQPGLYQIDLATNRDTEILALRINSPRVVFYDAISMTGPATIYALSRTEKPATARISSAEESQTVIAVGEDGYEQEVALESRTAGAAAALPLDAGITRLETTAPVRFGGAVFAAAPEQLFDPYQFDFTRRFDEISEVVITRLELEPLEDGWIRTRQYFTKAELSRLNVLRRIRFWLVSPEVRQTYERYQRQLVQEGFVARAVVGDYTIWGAALAADAMGDAALPLRDQLRAVFPAGSRVAIDATVPVRQEDFVAGPPPDWQSAAEPFTEIAPALRKSHRLLLYLDSSLALDAEKTDLNRAKGADPTELVLRPIGAKPVCQTTLPDDGRRGTRGEPGTVSGELHCSGLTPGVYELNIRQGNDAVLERLRLNTNKVVVADHLYTNAALDLFTQNPREREVTLRAWHPGTEQTAVVAGQQVEITTDQLGEAIRVLLPAQRQTISLAKGDLRLSGSFFAFAPDQWFDPFSLIITESLAGKKDGAVTDDRNRHTLELRALSFTSDPAGQ
jgi:hypothetical protein